MATDTFNSFCLSSLILFFDALPLIINHLESVEVLMVFLLCLWVIGTKNSSDRSWSNIHIRHCAHSLRGVCWFLRKFPNFQSLLFWSKNRKRTQNSGVQTSKIYVLWLMTFNGGKRWFLCVMQQIEWLWNFPISRIIQSIVNYCIHVENFDLLT